MSDPTTSTTGPDRLADAASTDETEALEDLRVQVTELRRALAEMGSSGVDAVVVGDPSAPSVYTLAPADRPYRAIVESMGEGAVTVSESGVVLYANPRIARVLGSRPDLLVGRDLVDFVPVDQLPELTRVMAETSAATRRAELVLPQDDGAATPYLVTATDIDSDGVRLRCLVFTDLSTQKLLERQVAQEAARLERQQVAVEVNDTIVQGLVAAEMAMDLEQFEYARTVVSRTSEHARQWIGRLATDGQILPGSAVRHHPARAGEETP